MAANTNHKQVSISSMLEVVRRRMLFVAVPAVLIAGVVCVYTFFYQPVRYRGDALMGVVNASGYMGGNADNTAPHVADYMLTIREALYSPSVLQPIAKEFRLCPLQADGSLSETDLESLKSQMKIQVEGDNSFHIQFEAHTAQQAMDVTNRISDLFIKRLSGLQQQQESDTGKLLGDELAATRQKLNAQEARISAYKEGSVSALPDRLDSNLRELQTLQAEMQMRTDKRNTDFSRLAALKQEMSELERQGVLKPLPVPKTEAQVQLDQMRSQLRQLQAQFTDDYPDIGRLKQQIIQQEKVVAATPPKPAPTEPTVSQMQYMRAKADKEQIEQRLQGYDQEDRAARDQMATLQARVNSTPVHESAIAGLTRDYEATRQHYNELLAKQQEVSLASRLQKNPTVGFRLIEPASLPLGPSTPARSRLLIMGLFASLGLGLVVAFVVEQMDSSFDSVDAFQDFTDMPVLCGLPKVSGLAQQGVQPRQGSVQAIQPHDSGTQPKVVALPLPELYRNRLVSVTDPHAVASEQYRILALKIEKQTSAYKCPVIGLTSSIGGEGKTLTSLNLAFSMAATSQRRVLLLETDLRKPRVHEYLGLKPTRGFSDLLLNPEADLDSHLWKVKDLYVMPGGTSLANPVELLSSAAATRVLDRLRQNFAFIVVDAPPVLPIVDTHILAGMVDGLVVVVRARYTKRELFQRAIESFQATNILGAVVNDIDYQRSRYAYAYKYYSKNYLTRT